MHIVDWQKNKLCQRLHKTFLNSSSFGTSNHAQSCVPFISNMKSFIWSLRAIKPSAFDATRISKLTCSSHHTLCLDNRYQWMGNWIIILRSTRCLACFERKWRNLVHDLNATYGAMIPRLIKTVISSFMLINSNSKLYYIILSKFI